VITTALRERIKEQKVIVDELREQLTMTKADIRETEVLLLPHPAPLYYPAIPLPWTTRASLAAFGLIRPLCCRMG